MSVTVTIVPLLVALSSMEIISITKLLQEELCSDDADELEPVETCFVDGELLLKTLQEHGFRVEIIGNSYNITTSAGSVRFFQKEAEGTYWALLYDLKSEEEMLACTDEITEEYLQNVQKNSYRMLKQQLSKNSSMHLESESVMEDDTIVLTIQL